MPATYLLHVLSRPLKVTPETWSEWYTQEHVPDLVNHGVTKTGAVYRAVHPTPLGMSPPDDKTFLAIYQSDVARPLDSDAFRDKVRHKSDKYFPDGLGSRVVGKFDIRNYEVIQVYDPKGVGDGPATFILHAELNPADAAEMDKWYREEHLGMIATHPGYRRSVRYRASTTEDGSLGENVSPFIALHEFYDVGGLEGPIKEWAETEWSKKILDSAKVFNVRLFKLISSEGL